MGDYYIGLDCGVGSVGWAVTDEKYNLLRAKGKTMWGSHLFEEAKSSADRRMYRSSRRKIKRARDRLKLLKILFSEEISKVDPNFYLRLKESFYRLEDKTTKKTKNVLFDDKNYKDSDYYNEYPTIWHLRNDIINSNDKKFDIRLYFLAIHHILKNRGHFMLEDEVLKGKELISEKMIKSFEDHKTDLKIIKHLVRSNKTIYGELFGKNSIYSSYIGNSQKAITQEFIGKVVKDDFKSLKITKKQIKETALKLGFDNKTINSFLRRLEENTILPKQHSLQNISIPMQQHRLELELILEKLGRDYPSFNKETDEDEAYNTKSKKILKLHAFKIPYYCGPIVGKDKSLYSWSDEDINENVYPWNFDKIIDLSDRANKFIRRMTNECAFIAGEDVLPVQSLVYQRYLVLNELNLIKLNGKHLPKKIKNIILKRVFEEEKISGDFYLINLEKWLIKNKIIEKNDTLSGYNSRQSLARLSTNGQLKTILGKNYQKKYSENSLEKAIEIAVILSNEKRMCAEKIEEVLKCSKIAAKKIANLNFKDWSNVSLRLLDGIKANVEGKNRSIIEALEDTSYTFSELMSSNFDFQKEINTINNPKNRGKKVTFDDIKELNCSNSVKRTIWRTLKIVREIKNIKGSEPSKIFVEMTRDDDRKEQRFNTRKKFLEKYLKGDKLRQELKNVTEKDLQDKKIYLYFLQSGKCAYSGRDINFKDIKDATKYSVDHIYPTSLTKDDSIIDNLVLVTNEYNRKKANKYPINPAWQEKMKDIWHLWFTNGLMSMDKFDRLMRTENLSNIELGNFISRQITETSQSVKLISALLKNEFKNTKIIPVKAKKVSELRQLMVKQGMNEFVKIRTLNDYHHAKDAYLNIVVGNVINGTFSDEPSIWIQKRNNQDYSISPAILFRSEPKGPNISNWDYYESISIISKTMRRNDVLCTRMNFTQSGSISDSQLIPKTDKKDGILPIKTNGRLDVSKYGGYRSLSGAYFTVIEDENKERQIVSIPIIYKNDKTKYLKQVYGKKVKIIYDQILYKSLMKIDDAYVYLAGRSGEYLSFWPAMQIVFDTKYLRYLKRVLKASEKIQVKGYKIDEYDGIDATRNNTIIEEISKKLLLYKNMPEISNKISEIITSLPKISTLNLEDQCVMIAEIMKIFGCNAVRCNLSKLVPKTNTFGRCRMNGRIKKDSKIYLIDQSITGLYEKQINLNAHV